MYTHAFTLILTALPSHLNRRHWVKREIISGTKWSLLELNWTGLGWADVQAVQFFFSNYYTSKGLQYYDNTDESVMDDASIRTV